MQAYSDPNREKMPNALPNIEIFKLKENELENEEGEFLDPGIYYWAKFPGRCPDSEPFGPFLTTKEALEDAQQDSYKIEKKSYYGRLFDGSERLFNNCWREFLTVINNGLTTFNDDNDVLRVLDEIASTRVNNPKSKFYMYG